MKQHPPTTGRARSLLSRERRRLGRSLALPIVVCCLLLGCYRQDMARQPKYHWPDQPSEFYPDGHANRPVEPDTVARGQLRADKLRFTGQTGPGRADEPEFATEFPAPVNEATLARGRERFNIYCAVCHGRTGYGNGVIWRRGYAKPPSYHDERLRTMPVGRMFDVVTHGFGAMPDYAEQIPVDDRWAIVAYIRALQYSQNVPAGDLTEADRAKVDAAAERKNGREGARGD
jgi:mono/diheme cytochrome c family protein